MTRHAPHIDRLPSPGSPNAEPRGQRWLLLVHQLPSTDSNARVRTWRRLQQLGALPIKQAVYVLPDTAGAREDFEWLTAEIKGAGGDATVFVADHVDAWSEDALVEEFRRSRQEAYGSLAEEIEKALTRANSARLVEAFRQRLTAIERIDFFGSAGRDRVTGLLRQLGERARGSKHAAAPAAGRHDAVDYRGQLWITRPRPGVDRMSSAWLIRRFIDPDARFGFAPGREAVPPNAIPFDMFGVEFGHQGRHCTFETLCAAFDIRQPGVERVAAIVHDVDLKDEQFGAPEAAAVVSIVEGLRLAHADDEALLDRGMSVFDALYRSFDQAARAGGPRPVAKARKRAKRDKRRR